ncbi:MAG: ComEC/Rec2 family competence protein, partial [Candidatus Binataceae bacterium]
FVMMWLSLPLAGTRGRSDDASTVESDADEARSRRRRFARHLRWRAAILVLLFAVLIGDAGWWSYQRYFDPDLRVTFLSVGEGDAAVVRFPGSRVMLVDGGGAFFGTFDPGEQIVAAYLWSKKIMHVDYIALSHPDRDHFGGLIFIARNFSPSQFWDSGVSSTDTSYGELLDAIKQAGARTRTVDADTPPLVIGGVMLRFLGPPSGEVEARHNNSSMVLRLTYDGASFLFTGDIEGKGERQLIAGGADLHAAVLKVPHHGSATSSTAEFVAAVDPQAAVISLGYHNQFHFPAAGVVDRYHAADAQVLRTDDVGAVMADDAASGLRLWTFRGGAVALPPPPHAADIGAAR